MSGQLVARDVDSNNWPVGASTSFPRNTQSIRELRLKVGERGERSVAGRVCARDRGAQRSDNTYAQDIMIRLSPS
jgi:hypothetical protein